MFCRIFFVYSDISCFVFVHYDSSSASSLPLPFFALRWPLALLDSSNDLLGKSNDAKVAKSFLVLMDFFLLFVRFFFFALFSL